MHECISSVKLTFLAKFNFCLSHRVEIAQSCLALTGSLARCSFFPCFISVSASKGIGFIGSFGVMMVGNAALDPLLHQA